MNLIKVQVVALLHAELNLGLDLLSEKEQKRKWWNSMFL